MTENIERILELAQEIVDILTPEPDPEPEPSAEQIILDRQGLVNTAALIAAAEATGVPLHIAAAFMQKESYGKNVYGHDTNGTFYGAGEVTEENFKEFYRLVVEEKQTSNGVGPMQITYPAYFPQAADEGLKLWEPYDNILFGLRIVARHLAGNHSIESIQRAGTLYNVGNLDGGITTYGRDASAKATLWAQRLGVDVPVSEQPDDPAPDPKPEPKPEPKVGDTIREGDTGPAVIEAQKRLTAHGWPEPKDGVPNGNFGSRMTTQTKAFQQSVGLDDDGVIGPDTWKALQAISRSEMRAAVIEILWTYGWKGAPSFTQAIKDFQAAVAFTNRALVPDGVVGPVTYNAALEFKRRGGKLSDHFTALEFQCRCKDAYPDCRRVWVKRSLLFALEKLRAKYFPDGLRVVSGCRCEQHNASLPGAFSRSQHRYGRGCDIEPRLTAAQVAALGVFSGIGRRRSDSLVVHVDTRADDGPDLDLYPYGTTSAPRIFWEG